MDKPSQRLPKNLKKRKYVYSDLRIIIPESYEVVVSCSNRQIWQNFYTKTPYRTVSFSFPTTKYTPSHTHTLDTNCPHPPSTFVPLSSFCRSLLHFQFKKKLSSFRILDVTTADVLPLFLFIFVIHIIRHVPSSLVRNDKRKARSCMWEIPKERGGRRRSKRLIRQTSWLVGCRSRKGIGCPIRQLRCSAQRGDEARDKPSPEQIRVENQESKV